MFSVQDLKDVISERLSAAVLEIHKVFQQTIVKREDVSDRHRRLLDNSWTRKLQMDNAVFPQQYLCKREALLEQQLNNQEKNSRIKQDELGPWQVKMEQEELCTGQDAEKLAIKLEPDIRLETPTVGLIDHGLSQQHVCKEEREDVLFEPQLNNQEELEALQVKMEQKELCTTQIAEKLAIKLESDVVLETPTAGQSDEQFYHSCVKELIGERLTAAVKEISTVFEKSISRFEEERRLMEIFWQPRVRLCRAEPSQQHVRKEKEEECLSMKQERPTFMATPTREDSDSETLFSHSSSANESQMQAGSEGIASGSRNAKTKAMATILESLCDTVTDITGFKCGICGKIFQSKVVLKRHCRTHTKKVQTKCDICSKTYSSKDSLGIHLRFHTGEKLCSCETCGKRFALMRSLIVHIRTHTGEKPYSCEMCGKSFTQDANYKVHMRIHTGEKPFSCEACGKRFIYQTHLKSHMRIHSDLRPYSCEKCSESFKHKLTLLRHIRRRHGG